MKNIHVFPTGKPSRIYLIKSNNKLGITSNNPDFTENFGSGTQNQHIYITSDEEIKEREYYIHGNRLHRHLGKKCLDVLTNKEYTQSRLINKDSVFKKVILTTDIDLFKDGVQAIDDEFLEWFVKNPSCEEVEVLRYKNIGYRVYNPIIIPKEEPKQETLEEVAERKFQNIGDRLIFEDGAKWQQERSYSEEEVDYLINLLKQTTEYEVLQSFKDKVEQFKKK
jgi:hypothetical protein